MITRAQIRRQLRKNGGIMNAVPRQGYFLGKIVKGVKKFIDPAIDVVTNVAKSPVGKAALLGAGLYGLGGGFGGNFGLGNIGPSIGRGLSSAKSGLFGVAPATDFDPGVKGLFGKLGLTKGAALLATFAISFGISFFILSLIPPKKNPVLGTVFIMPPFLRNCLRICARVIISIIGYLFKGRVLT